MTRSCIRSAGYTGPILNKTRLLLDWGVLLAFGTILFWGVNGKRRHV